MTRNNIRKNTRKTVVVRHSWTWKHRAALSLVTIPAAMFLVDAIHYELLAHSLEIGLPVAVDKFVFGFERNA